MRYQTELHGGEWDEIDGCWTRCKKFQIIKRHSWVCVRNTTDISANYMGTSDTLKEVLASDQEDNDCEEHICEVSVRFFQN